MLSYRENRLVNFHYGSVRRRRQFIRRTPRRLRLVPPRRPPPPARARTHRRQSLLSCRYRVERTSRQLHGVPAHRPRVELIPGARPVVPRAAFIRHGPGSRDDTGDTAARLFYSGLPAPCTPAQHRLIITLTPPPIVTAGNVCRF